MSLAYGCACGSRGTSLEDWMIINDAFQPYLTARDWMTIQKPVA